MGQKHGLEPRNLITILIVIAALAGMLLGKMAPMEAGFSSLYGQNNPVSKETTVATTIEVKQNDGSQSDRPTETETTSATIDPETQSQYMNQVNQEIQEGKYAGRLKVPLFFQTDERWKDLAYGSGEYQTLEKNGCAIVSLAMIASYLEETDVFPDAVLDWSKNDYFAENHGTNWTIFADFAAVRGYVYEELIDLNAVKSQLSEGHPVIISVRPGKFTEIGHIMLLVGFNEEKFWVNDPNDTQEKGHSKTQYTGEQLASEAMNYWTIHK